MAAEKVTHISALKAWEIIQNEPKVAFIDVRSDMEFLFIGASSRLGQHTLDR